MRDTTNAFPYPVVITSDNVCEPGNGFGCFRTGEAGVTYPTPTLVAAPSHSGLQSGTSGPAAFDGNIESGWGAGDHEGWIKFSFQERSFNRVKIYTGSSPASKFQTFQIQGYRNGVFQGSTGVQQRWVLSYAQGGSWLEFPITAATYDSLVVQQWGWRYQEYPVYWDDPAGGGWVGIRELWLGNGTAPPPSCGTPGGWHSITYSGLQSGTSGPAMFDGDVGTFWGAGDHQGWVDFSFQAKSFNKVKMFYTSWPASKTQTFEIEAYRNGQLQTSTGHQQRWVKTWAEGGSWMEFSINPGTYDRLLIRRWGWEYPLYPDYWDDPAGGGWVGVNELQLCSGS